jgi:hypothetical protein
VSIKLQCVCGKTLSVPDSLTGQKIRCKDCGKVMTVPQRSISQDPAKESGDDPLAVKNHRRCSGCGKSYPLTDKVCITCGLNLDTGAQLYVSLEDQSSPVRRATAGAGAPGAPKQGFVPRLLALLGLRK